MEKIKSAMTIAGSDPSGGAGLQADLKTFHQFGVYGTSIVTLLTVQNTVSVRSVETVSPEMVLAQMDAVLEDIPPAAAKTGALGTAAIVRAVGRRLRNCKFPLIVDPVMVSKHGLALMTEEARVSVIEWLFPGAFLVTPNLEEASVLTGSPVTAMPQMEEAARKIHGFGMESVLIKGGHLAGEAVDLLYAGGQFHYFSSPRIQTRNTHGTGCTFSAAITALIAQGCALPEAVTRAKKFITLAIESNPGLGAGFGPVNHHAKI
jgi:hydroxymethylpyrimidine/phosphomethylpyrimidine kinase